MSQPEVLDLLRRARALLASPERWTRGVYATTAGGELSLPDAPDAACFCILGALQRDCSDLERGTSRAAAVQLLRALDATHPAGATFTLVGFNDARETTHDDVLTLFDAAIANLEGA